MGAYALFFSNVKLDAVASGISRQPEASGSITVAMIISAALIEGAALFALVIAFTMGGVLDKETVSEFAKANKPVVEQQDQ